MGLDCTLLCNLDRPKLVVCILGIPISTKYRKIMWLPSEILLDFVNTCFGPNYLISFIIVLDVMLVH